MRRIDFISQGPQLSIFKEGANKTILGGVLYLIYSAALTSNNIYFRLFFKRKI